MQTQKRKGEGEAPYREDDEKMTPESKGGAGGGAMMTRVVRVVPRVVILN